MLTLLSARAYDSATIVPDYRQAIECYEFSINSFKDCTLLLDGNKVTSCSSEYGHLSKHKGVPE